MSYLVVSSTVQRSTVVRALIHAQVHREVRLRPAQHGLDPSPAYGVLTSETLRLDLEQDRNAVPCPLSNLGGWYPALSHVDTAAWRRS